ncbi:GspE/PulE family protein [Brockia lithotrophica]|uniref:Type II/IV secretion system protein n=1 Tax=Brockia lithotrophica TaxID=933949 RepID=A0A660L6A8_9BACL|nr:ATPase, T2SS/T4P/T4SS family [Brockia lithotrophica]RKQ88958.1 type II/IV secretion system protein [Brockia lithotrophica]
MHPTLEAKRAPRETRQALRPEELPAAEELETHILRKAVALRASDVHLDPSPKSWRVFLRVGRTLFPDAEVSRQAGEQLLRRLKLAAHLNLAETRLPQDGRFTREFAGEAYTFRVATLPTLYGEKATVRVLYPHPLHADLASLGISGRERARLERWLEAEDRLVLIAGAAGTGKTTALYAILATLVRTGRTVYTLEDPVEAEISGALQVDLDAHVGLTVGVAFRAVLRHDPDVVAVGEIRDAEAAFWAVHAALTGHLVLATLHAGSPTRALLRLEELGISPRRIREALRGILFLRRKPHRELLYPNAPPPGGTAGEMPVPPSCPPTYRTFSLGPLGNATGKRARRERKVGERGGEATSLAPLGRP